MSLRRTPPLCISPGFEPLEDRRLLACDVRMDGRTLFVRGDAADNDIAVRGDQDMIIVTCDGSFRRVPSGDVDSVQVKGGDGNDKLSAAAIAAALHLFGDDGDDSTYVDVDDDGNVEPTDVIGGGGHDTINISTSDLANILKILGTGTKIIPDPEITVDNAAGVELAHLFVQETEAIALNTWAGDDAIEIQNNGLLAGIDWTINTGGGADDVRFVVVPDPNNPAACPSAPERLTVNLGSTPGPDDMPGFLAEDHFLLDAAAGWCPSDPSNQPATIDIVGGQGSQKVKLDFGQIGSPLQQGFSDGLSVFAHLGAADDLAEMLTAGDIFMPVSLLADMGLGNDKFTASFLPKSDIVQANGGVWHGAVLGGPGDDTFMMNVGDANLPPPDPERLPHIGYDLDVGFDGGGGNDSFLIGMLNVAIDGSTRIMASGGGGADVFTNDYSLVEWRGPVTVQEMGGAGDDQFSDVMQKVRVDAGFMMNLNSGLGSDQAALEVREAACPGDPSLPPGPCQPIDIDMMTGGGRDTVTVTTQDLGVDLHLDVDLGNGDDSFTANILPDSSVGPGGGCIEANVNGGGGRDTFVMHTGGVNSPVPGLGIPHIAAELMLNFDGGAGSDSFLIGMLNVAISGPVTISEDGGEGNDSFNDMFSQVAAGGGAWNIAHDGGGGNDSLNGLLTDVFAELSYGANLGSGNDNAVIAIIRKAATGGLTGTALPAAAPGTRVSVLGAAGNDSINFQWQGPITGAADVMLDGGDGNDAIDALFKLMGQSAGSLSASVLGGGGNDSLGLQVFDDKGLVEMLLLDGGAGKDKCKATPNVTVVNCEK